MIDLKAMGTSDVIAMLALFASALSAFYAWYGIRSAQRQFDRSQQRELQVQLSANYLALETSSSDIFQYTADNAAILATVRGDVAEIEWNAPEREEARGVLLNLYYQSLNLFEVCARFRRNDQVKPEVFASWVAWFVEILEDSYFRAQWRPVIRSNYTRDVRDIFDVGVEIFEALPEPGREQAFYAAVADIMDCPLIADWLNDMQKEKQWNMLPSSPKFRSAGTSPIA